MENMNTVLLLLFSWTASVLMSLCADQQRETYAVEGHTTGLHCDTDLEDMEPESNFTFIWTKDHYTINTSARVKVNGSSLWILSTVSSDSGLYVCNSTDASVSMETRIHLSVEERKCPRVQEVPVPVLERTDINLPCFEEPIETLGQILQMSWWKSCERLGEEGSEISLVNVSMSSAGDYTCMVIFSHEGENYTASHTVQLRVIKNEPVEKPQVKHPRNQTVHTKPGEKTNLECSVFIGSGDEAKDETTVYWTVNDEFAKIYPQLQEQLTLEKRGDNQIYGTSTLDISEVLPEFFGVPFRCIIMSPRGTDVGVMWLCKYEITTQTPLITALVLITVAVLLIVLLMIYKLDIILAYRDLCCKGKITPQDRKKIYNAYVSYCHANIPGSTMAQNLALNIMPEVLEQQHDLKLFIHGRDDTVTEANDSDMTDAVSQSRVVLLILPESHLASDEEEISSIPLSPGQDDLDASHGRELYSVIAQSSVPVIVVESGENSNYSLLPESLRVIVPKNKVLRWKPTVQPNGRFWKLLRYHMT